jgi:glucose-6-phosphate 1-dehydrogenase
MTSNRSVGSFSLVIFGATGDLAKRKLFPALFSLYKREQLPEDFQVIGIGRSIRSVGDFHQAVKDSVHSFGRIKAENEEEWSRFIRHFQFVTSSVDDPAGYQQMKALIDEKEKAWQGAGNGNRLFYLAIAPDLYGTVSSHLKESGLTRTNGWKRIIIEKPIGHDYESAKQLNEQIKKAFTEEEIYRIDH